MLKKKVIFVLFQGNENRLSFTVTRLTPDLTNSYVETYTTTLSLGDSLKIGFFKISTCTGYINSIYIRMSINNRQLFTSSAVAQNENFYFAIPPEPNGKTIKFEVATISPIQFGQCLFQIF
jgi:hypothetical protein